MASKEGRRETTRAYGKNWGRYPDAERITNRYFRAWIPLHVYVWEMYYRRPVPDGYVVHHIDGDPTNNDIENLFAMPASEHMRLHVSERYDIDRLRQLAAIGREHAKAWHGTPEGRRFHAEIGKLTWEGAYEVRKACESCGREYTTWNLAECRSRFCSNKCKSAWRRRTGFDNEQRTCPYCGASFTVNKYARTTHCSRVCANRHRFAPEGSSL